MEKRNKALTQFIEQSIANKDYQLSLLAGDASFRKYYRLLVANESYVVMDAPPEKEPLTPFLSIAITMGELGLKTPKVIGRDETQGFLILTDFGDDLLFSIVNQDNADLLYQSALESLHLIQSKPQQGDLQSFDEGKIRQQLHLFDEWFLGNYLSLDLSHTEQALIEHYYALLVQRLSEQPQVMVHLDYHSRNLMWLPPSTTDLEPAANHIGVIDFQDARWGPIGYDLVSLFKDCYIEWPQARRDAWLDFYQKQSHYSFDELNQWLDYCGIQRHMKVLGIFCRLYLRDNKSNYLKDLPLTLKYLTTAAEKYDEFGDLFEFITKRIKLP